MEERKRRHFHTKTEEVSNEKCQAGVSGGKSPFPSLFFLGAIIVKLSVYDPLFHKRRKEESPRESFIREKKTNICQFCLSQASIFSVFSELPLLIYSTVNVTGTLICDLVLDNSQLEPSSNLRRRHQST